MKLDHNPITGTPGTCIAVGRGSTGIYLALKEAQLGNGCVLVPGNLCYAGIYPVLYAGMTPVFCDVNPQTGNVTLETVVSVWTDSICAAIIPHMYGNPVAEFPEIHRFLQEQGALLIEDCASSMGAQAENYLPGTIGEYVVYSTGSAKTIDLGYGGLLFSQVSDLTATQATQKALPLANDNTYRDAALFSKIYRLLRNEGSGTAMEAMVYSGFPSACRDSFLFQLSTCQEAEIWEQLKTFPSVLQLRRKKLKQYLQHITAPEIVPYAYLPGAVPWRFSFYIDTAVRKPLIQACLAAGLPVSDWYPNVTALFGQKMAFSGIDWHEHHILNFPLLLDDQEIMTICDFLNHFFKSKE